MPRIFVAMNIKEIAALLARTDDAELIESFLLSLLTQKEVAEVYSRWELVKLIAQGFPQRKIAEQLGISLCKITRGSRELKKENSAFRKMLTLLSESTVSE